MGRQCNRELQPLSTRAVYGGGRLHQHLPENIALLVHGFAGGFPLEALISTGLSQMKQLCFVCEERALPFLREGISSVTAKGSGRTAIMGFFS